MREKSKEKHYDFYQAYREYIEFVNELSIVPPASTIFLLVSSTIIITDLLLELAPNNHFIRDVTYLGLSTTLYEIARKNDIFCYTLIGIVLFALLSPLIAILSIVIATYSIEKPQNGVFKQFYQKSFVNSITRIVLATFPYFGLPLLTSFGIKLPALGTTQTIFGVIILVLTSVNCLLTQYHTFQLGNQQTGKEILVPINYPYRLIDDSFVAFCLIAINLTNGLVSQIIGILFSTARLVLALYIPFYFGKNDQRHKLIILATLIFNFGLLVSSIDEEYYFTLFLIFILIAMLIQTKFRNGNPDWEMIGRLEPEGEGLAAIRHRLWNEGLFVRSFRDLILLSRKNNSHRNQLQIQILKSKCSAIEKINRGGGRVCGSSEVIVFEQKLILFIQNLLEASQLSVSVLKFLQSRQGRNQVLGKAVGRLVGLLMENKLVIKNLLEINEHSPQARLLLMKTYGQLYQDSAFLRESQIWTSESLLGNQKQIKQKLFGEKMTVIFINVLEQIGKITKISKNLPGVLGYQPSNLIGLSINEIIPFSIKPYHDSTIVRFVENYSDKHARREMQLQFYAYNQDFHLQEVIIGYNWIMRDFNYFQMAGTIERIDSQTNIILTDEFGNLQGWTKKIGGQEFNLDELTIGERKNFNIMPLFPTLIKYMDSQGVCVKTLFFKHSKPRDPNLMIIDSNKPDSTQNLQQKLLAAFRKMLREQQIVGACFAEIEFFKMNLCQGKAKMRQIIIRTYQRIENFSEVIALIERVSTPTSNNGGKTDRSIAQGSEAIGQGSQKQQLSVFSQQQKTDRKIDSNFTLNPEGNHLFPLEQLVFGQFSASRTSFEISNVYQQQLRRKVEKQEKSTNATPQSGFNPNLQKNSTLFWYVILVTIGFIILVVFNITAVVSTSKLMSNQCVQVVKRNRAMMIYLKSVFNPNETYINQFLNGDLLESQDYLFSQYFNYVSFLNDTIRQNKYYLFNTQVPATLQRLLKNPLNSDNTTVDIIPPTTSLYYSDIKNNYIGIVTQFNKKFTDSLGVWSQNISSIKTNMYIRLVFLCLASIAYAFLLILLHLRQRRHNDTLEAFFKFEKEDLQKKIASVGQVVREVQAQVSEWHLLKDFSEIVKRKDITNIEFSLIKNPHEVKIKFQFDQQTQNNLEKRSYYIAMLILGLFLITQTVFLALHATINLNALNYFQTSPYELDSSSKLIVLPNYLIADLYLPLPESIKTSYDNSINKILTYPIASIPQLHDLLSTAPCLDCNFMYPVLTTNFKSFYSTFEQRIAQMKNSNNKASDTVQDLFYAADFVVSRLLEVLVTSSYNYFDFSLVIYGVAMVILCAAIHLGTQTMNEQIEKLELFLKFFSQQTITKNKHMNRLFSNS